MVNIMFSSARNCRTVTDYGASLFLFEHELFYESRPHNFPYIALSALPIFIKIPRMCKLVSLIFFVYKLFPLMLYFFQLFFSVFCVYAYPVLLRFSELKVCYLLE